MTGPGGDEVARVSVRVVPNTDDFKRDLERQLQSLRDEEIKIPVKLDLDKADLERQLEELDLKSITIPVNFDVENVRDDIERATRGAKADPIKVPVELDEDDLGAQIARVEAELRDLDSQEVSPEVILQATDLREQLRNLKAELAELSAQEYDIRVGEDGITEVRASIFDLKATLSELQNDPTQIKFDLDEAELLRNIAEVEGELEKLDGKEVTPEIGAKIAEALAELAAFQAKLNELDGKRIEAIASLDVDTLRADARIQAFITRMNARRGIKIPVDVDESSFSGLERKIRGALGNVGAVLTDVFSGIGAAISRITDNWTLTGAIKGAATAALQLGLLLARLGPLAIGLAAAGAGITAAWGAAAAAISAVPAALFLIGAPAAAVALGLDGIKKAAAGIKPEFDALKASISSVFEQGLTPILNNIAKKVFPDLQAGLQGTARALIDLAGGITDVVVRAAQFGQLKIIFDNVNTSLRNIQPGIQDLVTGFLLLAQQSGAFDVLTTAVNTFGAAFKNNVIATINDGSLDAAFKGLEGTLKAVAQGFADLVKNGIEVFARAAPGVNQFINDLTGFFNRFDWDSLGESVGGVFRGLGDTLRNIPQGTIDAIASSFQRLSQVFNDKSFQAGLQVIIGLIPGAIDWIGRLASAFARTALALQGSYNVIVGAVKSIALALQALTDDPSLLFSDKFKAELDAANAQVVTGLGQIEQSYANFDPQLPPSNIPNQIGGELDTVVATAEQKMAALRTALQKGMTEAQTTMVAGWKGTGSATVAAATAALAPVPAVGSAVGQDFFKAWDAELDQMDAGTKENLQVITGSVGGELSKVPPAAGAALAPLPGEVGNALGQVPPAANAALAPLEQLQVLNNMKTSFGVAFLGLVGTARLGMESIAVTVGDGMAGVFRAFNFENVGLQLGLAFQGMVGTVSLGMAALAATVTGGMPQIQAGFNFTGIATQIGTVFLGLVGTFSLGMASLAQTVLGGMPQIQAAFNFEGITTQIGTVFLGLVGTFSLGMASLAATVTAGIPLIQAAFNFTGLQAQIGNVFLGMVGTFNLGMASLAAAVTAGMVGLQAAFNFTGLQAQIGNFFLGLVGTFSLGMASIAATVTAGMAGVQAAFNFTGIATQIGAVFIGLVGTFNRGMASLAAAVSAGMSGVQASFNFTGIQAAASAGMAGVTSTIQAGMSTAVAAVNSGVAAINAAMAGLTASVAASVAGASNQFRSLGTAAQASAQVMNAAMVAMANSARQMQAAVTAAMNAVVAAVQAGVARAAAAANAAAGQFRAAGANMGRALADGLNSQAGAVQAAANRLAAAAAAAVRAQAQIRSPSRVFMDLGDQMGAGLALGLEQSTPRITSAAHGLVTDVADSFDEIVSRVTDADWASKFSGNVEASLGDTRIDTSNRDLLGQQRIANGELSQSTVLLSAIIAELRALRAQAGKGDSVIGATASSRRTAELGAF